MRLIWVLAGVMVLNGCGRSAPTAGSSAPGGSGASETSATLPPGAPADFAICLGCHTLVKTRNGIGPSLVGVVGRKSGSLPGFDYSMALKRSGIVWSPVTLDRWLSGPMDMVPGTKMSFGGFPDRVRRQAIIAYLKTLR